MNIRTSTLAILLSGAATLAVAQTSPSANQPATQPGTPPAASPSAPMNNAPGMNNSGNSMNRGAQAPASGMTAGNTAKPQFMTQQAAGQWATTKVMGADVYNAQNESIGSIKDVVFDSQGQAMAAVIGVGGVLGVGAKDVAIDYKSLQINRDEDGDPRIVVNATRETLEQAPEYKYNEPEATGSTPAPGSNPAPSAKPTPNRG